jgi:hypothetical protein
MFLEPWWFVVQCLDPTGFSTSDVELLSAFVIIWALTAEALTKFCCHCSNYTHGYNFWFWCYVIFCNWDLYMIDLVDTAQSMLFAVIKYLCFFQCICPQILDMEQINALNIHYKIHHAQIVILKCWNCIQDSHCLSKLKNPAAFVHICLYTIIHRRPQVYLLEYHYPQKTPSSDAVTRTNILFFNVKECIYRTIWYAVCTTAGTGNLNFSESEMPVFVWFIYVLDAVCFWAANGMTFKLLVIVMMFWLPWK